MDYQKFLKNKRHLSIDHGIEPEFLPDDLFDYQRYVTEYAIKKGRCAVFLDTGLGKTLIELVVAMNYQRKTGKPVLILCPLAVAFQFIEEAKKFGIDGIEYSKDGAFNSPIVVCNYERLKHFYPKDFDCVILDESSILKNVDGKIKHQVTQFLKKVKYRYLFTATPSPNDFVELGTSSEALGYMGYADMLSRFFSNKERTIKPQNIGTKWILKAHAKRDFFTWVSSWSISMRKPSDLGFSDENNQLPELITRHHSVKNPHNLVVNTQVMLFNQPSTRLTEVRQENRQTISIRCEKAVELTQGSECAVYWCNFNDESKTLASMDRDAVEILGPMSIDAKEEILKDFLEGRIKKLITKPKITAFGLNWQHCNHTVYFPSFSYEQYYQSIRRFYRFGQQQPVTVDLVYSDGMDKVIQSLAAKKEKADKLFSELTDQVNGDYKHTENNFNQSINLPTFLR